MSNPPVGRKWGGTPGREKWMGLALGLAIALQVGVAHAEVVARNAAEGDDDFMGRVLGPSVELTQKVVRSTEIAGGKLTLIAFVNGKEGSPDGEALIGHLLIETSPNHYDHVTFPSCEEEGAAPDLLAVFFARTVKEGGRDLAVLCKWDDRHADVNGTSYAAKFYRLKETASKVVVEPVADLNKKFQTDDLSTRNERGKWVDGPKPKFKTVAEVKKLLTKMGLKQ